jgi:hypothetical protein
MTEAAMWPGTQLHSVRDSDVVGGVDVAVASSVVEVGIMISD